MLEVVLNAFHDGFVQQLVVHQGDVFSAGDILGFRFDAFEQTELLPPLLFRDLSVGAQALDLFKLVDELLLDEFDVLNDLLKLLLIGWSFFPRDISLKAAYYACCLQKDRL